ncbi:hypothetical protein Tco_0303812 [Tanacetum coccineum]
METGREALWECRQLEKVQGSWKEVRWCQRKEQMSRIREQVILRTKNISERGPNSGPVSLEVGCYNNLAFSGPMPLEKTWDREDIEETFSGKTWRYSLGPDRKEQPFHKRLENQQNDIHPA